MADDPSGAATRVRTRRVVSVANLPLHYRVWLVRPLLERARVRLPPVVAENPQHERTERAAGAAVAVARHACVGRDAPRLQQPMKIRGGLHRPALGVEQFGPLKVHGARDTPRAGYRAEAGGLAGVLGGGAGIPEHEVAASYARFRLGERAVHGSRRLRDIGNGRPRGELRVERPALGQPLRDAAVENAHVRVPVIEEGPATMPMRWLGVSYTITVESFVTPRPPTRRAKSAGGPMSPFSSRGRLPKPSI